MDLTQRRFNSYNYNAALSQYNHPHNGIGALIFGGVEAVPHEFPFMVEILANGKFRCGGSLIGTLV